MFPRPSVHHKIPREIVHEKHIWDLPDFKNPVKTMLPWQKRIFNLMKSVWNGVLVATSGSGKTFLALCLGINEIRKEDRKQVYLVPQVHISYGFTGRMSSDRGVRMMYEGEEILWRVLPGHDCCDSTSNPVQMLEEFMLNSVSELKLPAPIPGVEAGLSCVASYASFVKLWKKWDKKQKKKALKDTTIYYDEGHHITAVEGDDLSGTDLGRVVDEIIKINEKTCKLRMMTATFYRGDLLRIISWNNLTQFPVFELPWSEYYQSLGIEEFYFNFVTYRDTPIKTVIATIKQHPNRYHLITLPKRGQSFRDREDHVFDELMKQLCAMYSEDQILDLVADKIQHVNKKKLYQGHSDGYKVVVACDMMNEGTDWPPCDYIHNCCPGNSIQREEAVLGRGTRIYPGKTQFTVDNYVPQVDKTLQESVRDRDVFTDRMNAILMALVVSNLWKPLKMPKLPSAPTFYNGSDSSSGISLKSVLRNDGYINLTRAMLCAYEALEDKSIASVKIMLEGLADDYYYGDKLIRQVWSKEVRQVWSKEDFRFQIMANFLRANHLCKGKKTIDDMIDASFIRELGFDKVARMQGRFLGSLVFGTPDTLRVEDFKALKKIAINKGLTNPQEYLDFFEFEERNKKEEKAAPGFFPVPPRTNLTGHWVSYVIPNDGKVGRVYARVIADHGGGDLEAVTYRDVTFEHQGFIFTDKKGKRFKFCGKYWKRTYLPANVTEPGRNKKLKEKFLLDKETAQPALLPREWVSGIAV